MHRTYNTSVPTPSVMRPTWGEGPILALCYTTSPTRAAQRLGVPANKLGTTPEGVEVGEHDRQAAANFPDVAVYRSPVGPPEWRVLDRVENEE